MLDILVCIGAIVLHPHACQALPVVKNIGLWKSHEQAPQEPLLAMQTQMRAKGV